METHLSEGFFLLSETDKTLSLHWKSGSLKYSDFRLMAEGGTAKLYTCFDENLRRKVVYKTLHDHLKNSPIETHRFLREARVTANIAHPGTLPVYELGRDRNGSLFFTMKHINGRDLRSIILSLDQEDVRTKQLFPLSVLIDILIQVCQTVAHAHQRGVVHRDLKPANILTGEFGETYVIDWGLAKVWGENDISTSSDTEHLINTTLTPVGRRYGTPLYTAPELIRGDKFIDGRVDVFCLGNVLFEILTHKQLLHGETVKQIRQSLLENPLPKPSQVAPNRLIPTELEHICCRALQRKVEDRFDSVQSLLVALLAYRSKSGQTV